MRSLGSGIAALLLLTASGASALPVRLVLEPRGTPASAPVEGTLHLAPEPTASSEGAAGPEPLEVPAQVPGVAELDLPSGTAWRARFSAAGTWSEPLAFVPGSAPAELEIPVFPEARLRGRLLTPERAPVDGELSVRVHSVPGPGEGFEATALCRLSEGALDCSLPAGRWDLRLRHSDFTPVYLWGVEVPARSGKDVGDLRLRRGASVSGWVETEDGRPPAPGARARLDPVAASRSGPAVQDRLAATALEAEVNDRGFFQIPGVPPGSYALAVSGEGFAPARVAPVLVREGLESQVIDRIVLAPPARLEVVVDPPVEPYGKPWRIEIARRSDPRDPPRDFTAGTASPEGLWQSPPLAPGTWELRVRGELNDTWFEDFVVVERGMAPLAIEIPVLRVQGTVLLGNEPLSATVWLQQRGGRRLRFDSDAEGRFAGVLPAEGAWFAEVVSELEKLRVFLEEPIEVEVPEGGRAAEVEIALPDTELAGEVVDGQGRPVPGASVYAVRLGKRAPNRAAAGEDGEFSIRGITPGSLAVRAEKAGATSEWLTAELREGEPARLRIVLQKSERVSGRIVSATGGVAGARVVLSPPLAGGPGTHVAEAVTGPDGGFEVRLPVGEGPLDVLALPPGHALRLAQVQFRPGQPLEIAVDSQGGTLTLELGSGPRPLLFHGNTFTLVPLLEDWARLHRVPRTDPDRLVLPNVSPGAYSLCRGPGTLAPVRDGGEPPAARCDSGFLGPFGELVLRAP